MIEHAWTAIQHEGQRGVHAAIIAAAAAAAGCKPLLVSPLKFGIHRSIPYNASPLVVRLATMHLR